MAATRQAQAAGFWNLDRGVMNRARGGADIASPHDPSALYTNPAALADLPGLQILVEGNAVQDSRSFARSPDDIDGDGNRRFYQQVTNDSAIEPTPGFFASYNFDDITVGAGLWGPLRADTLFPDDGAQRHALIRSDNLQINTALGLGWELPWFGMRVGVTGQLVTQQLRTNLALNVLTSDNGEPENDAVVAIDVKDSWIPTASFALSAAPSAWWTLAAVYQMGFTSKLKGTAKAKLGPTADDFADISGNKASATVDMPAAARLAVQWHEPANAYDIEAAVVWEGWSASDNVDFVPENISYTSVAQSTPTKIKPIALNTGFRDALSFRLGGSYAIGKDFIRLNAGGFYEQGATPNNRISALAFDLNKFGFGAGVRWFATDFLWADVAGGMTLWQSTTVTDSKVRLTNAITGAGPVVANGTYQNTQIYAMLALGLKLGAD